MLCVHVFSTNLFMTLFSKKKKHNEYLYFVFILFCLLNVIVFVYTALKQNLILQTKLNQFSQIFFIGPLFLFISKKHLALYVERLGYEFCCYICHISLILHCKFVLILPGNLISGEKKKCLFDILN